MTLLLSTCDKYDLQSDITYEELFLRLLSTCFTVSDMNLINETHRGHDA